MGELFIQHPLRNHPLKLGRSEVSRPALNLRDFVDIEKAKAYPVKELPTVDYTSLVRSWPMFGNDSIGDCTCAAVAHGKQVFDAMVGRPFSVTDQQVVTMYEASGYNPADPSTDQGWTLAAAAQYLMKNGLQGTPDILAYAEVSLRDDDAQQVAMELFGGLYEGAALPKSAQSQYSAGHVWSVTNHGHDAGTWGGHAMWRPKAALRKSAIHVTWGGLQASITAWDHAYIDELIVVVPTDWESKMPSALVKAGLVDFSKLRSLVSQWT